MNIMTAHCYSCLLQQPVTTNTTMSGYERRYTSSAESRAARLRRLPDCDGVVTQVKVEYASADINGFYNKEGKSDGVAKFTKPSSEHDGKKYMIFRSAHTDGSRRWYLSLVHEESDPGTTQDNDYYFATYDPLNPGNPDPHIPPSSGWLRFPDVDNLPRSTHGLEIQVTPSVINLEIDNEYETTTEGQPGEIDDDLSLQSEVPSVTLKAGDTI